MIAKPRTTRCDVREGLAARFDVTLADGTQYLGAGIHGEGGVLRGEGALANAKAIVAAKSKLDATFQEVLIYTLHTASDYRFKRVTARKIKRVKLSD